MDLAQTTARKFDTEKKFYRTSLWSRWEAGIWDRPFFILKQRQLQCNIILNKRRRRKCVWFFRLPVSDLILWLGTGLSMASRWFRSQWSETFSWRFGDVFCNIFRSFAWLRAQYLPPKECPGGQCTTQLRQRGTTAGCCGVAVCVLLCASLRGPAWDGFIYFLIIK